MATAMATLSLPTAVPVSRSPVSLSSAAHFGGAKVRMATPHISQSSRVFVVRAGESILDKVKRAFGGAKKETDNVAYAGKKEVDKGASKVKSASGDLEGKAAGLKDDLQEKAEEASSKVKSGVEDLQKKVEDAAEQAKS